LSLPDLRERLEAGRVRYQTGWLAGGGHQCSHPLQLSGRVGGILIRFHGDAMTQFSHLARRDENREQRAICPSAIRLNWVTTKHTTKSSWMDCELFNRAQAMLGTSGPRIATDLTNKIVLLCFHSVGTMGASRCSMQCHRPISLTSWVLLLRQKWARTARRIRICSAQTDAAGSYCGAQKTALASRTFSNAIPFASCFQGLETAGWKRRSLLRQEVVLQAATGSNVLSRRSLEPQSRGVSRAQKR